jgi:hypothetical protein
MPRRVGCVDLELVDRAIRASAFCSGGSNVYGSLAWRSHPCDRTTMDEADGWALRASQRSAARQLALPCKSRIESTNQTADRPSHKRAHSILRSFSRRLFWKVNRLDPLENAINHGYNFAVFSPRLKICVLPFGHGGSRFKRLQCL